jgi:uncharacterized protein YggL (DUF469 family)
MKKRLRKKKRLGEFREWGMEIVADVVGLDESLDSSQGAVICEGVLDDVIEYVESRSFYCAGGVNPKTGLDIVVELGKAGSEAQAVSYGEEVASWFRSHPLLTNVRVGRVFDLWHLPSGISLD